MRCINFNCKRDSIRFSVKFYCKRDFIPHLSQFLWETRIFRVAANFDHKREFLSCWWIFSVKRKFAQLLINFHCKRELFRFLINFHCQHNFLCWQIFIANANGLIYFHCKRWFTRFLINFHRKRELFSFRSNTNSCGFRSISIAKRKLILVSGQFSSHDEFLRLLCSISICATRIYSIFDKFSLKQRIYSFPFPQFSFLTRISSLLVNFHRNDEFAPLLANCLTLGALWNFHCNREKYSVLGQLSCKPKFLCFS